MTKRENKLHRIITLLILIIVILLAYIFYISLWFNVKKRTLNTPIIEVLSVQNN